MNNFYFYNPTKIIFGRHTIANIIREIPSSARILIIYGGGRAVLSNGALEQVRGALSGCDLYEFSGIGPNPEYQKCLQAISLVKEHGIDFLLAVGGGSVIDAAKFIALASYCCEEKEPWDFVKNKRDIPSKALPVGVVLTMPASGSEMNNSFVISHEGEKDKIPCSSPVTYPRFSVLDPELTFSLSAEQTANGIVDIFIHVLEQYLTYGSDFSLQARQSEAILLTLIDVAPRLLNNLYDYDLRSEVMWCATQAMNGNINRGVPCDWSTHDIGHKITALYGLVHAHAIAVVLGGVLRNQLPQKKGRLIQYGKRVWGLEEGDPDETALLAISKTEHFFEELGVKTKISDYGLDVDEVSKNVLASFKKILTNNKLGENRNIGHEELAKILSIRL